VANVAFNVKIRGLADLASWLIEARITVYHSVPTLFRHFIHTLNGDEVFDDLRLIHLGGESIAKQDVLAYKKHFADHCVLISNVGCTEVSSFAQYLISKTTEIPGDVVPVGYPVEGKAVLLLDDEGREVEFDEVGEIVIKSPYLALGYWRKPALTERKILADPEDNRNRLYHTGDLGRRSSDGRLFHLGRKDRQVQIRGYRVEIAEIEVALLSFDQVKEVAVVDRKGKFGDTQLVAYVVPNEQQSPTLTGLHQYLTTKIPDYMIPAAFHFLTRLPQTPNGKIDRLALVETENHRPQLDTLFVPPKTEAEIALEQIWRDVLEIDSIGIQDNFFELGGHSLLATQVISRIQKNLGTTISFRSFFEAPTIYQLAQYISIENLQQSAASIPLLEPVLRTDSMPLSFAQQRMWFLDQLDPENSVYHISAAYRLTGSLNVAALTKSINQIVQRHENLRACFPTINGNPVQIIHSTLTIEIPIIDLRADFAKAPEDKQLLQLATEEAKHPFDLATGPLLRVKLLRLAGDEYVLLTTMHHIISDGWSVGIFRRELATLYEAFSAGEPSSLSPLPIQYLDFSVWQRNYLQGERLDRQITYWKNQLSGELPKLNLPTNYPR
ncbi:MAG: condensation domain-containing protein, partial [Chloroflexota bacterium]